MLTAFLADPEPSTLDHLKGYLETYCPHVQVAGIAHSPEEVNSFVQKGCLDLLIIDKKFAHCLPCAHHQGQTNNWATIIMLSSSSGKPEIPHLEAFSFLPKPLSLQSLILAITHAQQWIYSRQAHQYQVDILQQLLQAQRPATQIAIPTMEGMEFLQPSHIIRCEGLQKYTLVITTESREIVSSYNIGEFCKKLQSFGFFASHRSHLVNLQHIRKLTNEGSICMCDQSHVPLSRRRRREFLNQFHQVGTPQVVS